MMVSLSFDIYRHIAIVVKRLCWSLFPLQLSKLMHTIHCTKVKHTPSIYSRHVIKQILKHVYFGRRRYMCKHSLS